MSHVSPVLESRLAAMPSSVARQVSLYLGAVLAAYLGLFLYLETTPGVLDRQGRVRGRDFLGFYVHGRILAEGGGPTLYDAEHFRRTQHAIVSITETRPRYYSLYPPAAALFFVPFAELPYESALLLWWLLSVVCLVAVGVWFHRVVQPSAPWKVALLILLAAFGPVLSTLLNGQMAGFFLLVVVCGLEAHQRGRSFLAGCLLSLLTLKPRLAVGPVLWLACRRDWRTLAGFTFGVLVQTGFTAACVGTEVFVAYVENLRFYSERGRIENYTADHHALAGVLRKWGGPE